MNVVTIFSQCVMRLFITLTQGTVPPDAGIPGVYIRKMFRTKLIFSTLAQAVRRVQEYLLLSLLSLKDPVTRVRDNVFFLINILYYVANRLQILNHAHYSGEKSLHFTEMMKGPCQAITFS